jgi:hypothetical protein
MLLGGMTRDGRNASKPYRVRAGGTWYWVDPSVPASAIEPGDTVILYPASGDAHVAVLQRRADTTEGPMVFAVPDGERFDVEPRDIAVLHLAAVDEDQG